MSTKVAKKQSSNLVAATGQFLAFSSEGAEYREALAENMTGGAMSAFDLDIIKVPIGGVTLWETPDGEHTKVIRGIIVAHHDVRGYWPDDYTGEKTPPACYSDNGDVGVGTPGGSCGQCPMAKFGSKANGRGQACKLMKRWFLLPEDSVLPIMVHLAPSSYKNGRQHLMRLGGRGVPYYGAVTELTLEKAHNQDGIAYTRVAVANGGVLDGPSRAAAKAYAKEMGPMLIQAGAALADDDI